MATRDVVFSANVDGNGGSGKEPPGSGDSEEQISFKNMVMRDKQAIPHNARLWV